MGSFFRLSCDSGCLFIGSVTGRRQPMDERGVHDELDAQDKDGVGVGVLDRSLPSSCGSLVNIGDLSVFNCVIGL